MDLRRKVAIRGSNEEETVGDISMGQHPEYRGLSAGENLEVNCIATGPDKQIVCGDANGTLLSFDYTSGAVIKQWNGHARSVAKVCVQTSSTGEDSRILSSSRDLSLKLWNIGADVSCQQEFKGHHELVISGAAFNPSDRNVICSGSRDNSMALWDIQSARVTRSSKIARNLVTDICWKELLLAQTSEDKMLRLWDPRTLQVTQSFALKQQILTSCDVNDIQIATTSGGFNGTGCEVTLWDSRKGTLPLHEFRGHTEKVHQCRYVTGSADATVYLASVSADQTIKLWNCKSLAEESSYTIGWQVVALAHLSTDSQSISFGVASPDSGAHVVTVDVHTRNHWQIHT